jgi:hypothetical protein
VDQGDQYAELYYLMRDGHRTVKRKTTVDFEVFTTAMTIRPWKWLYLVVTTVVAWYLASGFWVALAVIGTALLVQHDWLTMSHRYDVALLEHRFDFQRPDRDRLDDLIARDVADKGLAE